MKWAEKYYQWETYRSHNKNNLNDLAGLTFTTLGLFSRWQKMNFFLFFPENRIGHWTCQILCHGKNKKNISICHLLKILPRVLSVISFAPFSRSIWIQSSRHLHFRLISDHHPGPPIPPHLFFLLYKIANSVDPNQILWSGYCLLRLLIWFNLEFYSPVNTVQVMSSWSVNIHFVWAGLVL